MISQSLCFCRGSFFISVAALALLSWALEKHLTVLGDTDPTIRETAAKILDLLKSIQPPA